jgi:hypothetical protein
MRDGVPGWVALGAWAVSVIGVAVIAERRGRRAWPWLLIAIPFGLLALVPLLLSPRRSDRARGVGQPSDGHAGGKGWSATRIRVASAVAIVAVAVIAGLAYFLGSHQGRVQAAIAVAQASGSPCTVSDSAQEGRALASHLLPEQGLRVRVSGLYYGVLSLDRYVQELYPARLNAETSFLRSLCFQSATHDTWRTPDGVTTSVWLVRFATSAQARAYTLETEQGDIAAIAGASNVSVPGVPDGMTITAESLDAYGNIESRLLGDRGHAAIIIHLFRPAAPDQQFAIDTLRAQYFDLGPGEHRRLGPSA